jgi:hypothetical protein
MAIDTCRQHDLFATLGKSHAPDAKAQIAEYFRRCSGRARPFLLAIEQPNPTGSETVQLELELDMQDEGVIRFVPLRSRIYLDYGVYDMFRDLRSTRTAALRLEEHGVGLVSALVAMTEQQVRSFRFVTDDAFDGMSDRLGRLGIGFRRRTALAVR